MLEAVLRARYHSSPQAARDHFRHACPEFDCDAHFFDYHLLRQRARIHAYPKAPCPICGKPLKSGCHPTHLKDVHRKDDDPKYLFGICD